MQDKKILIAADHAGCPLKEGLVAYLKSQGFTPIDYGTDDPQTPSDYPDQAALLARGIAEQAGQYGVLICGSGIGMSIAVNRYPFIRGALVYSPKMAELARRHNNANVLILGGRMTDITTATQCLDVFLTTPFDGGRHTARVAKLERMPG